MKNGLKFDLQLFGHMHDSSFFQNAYQESIDNPNFLSYDENKSDEVESPQEVQEDVPPIKEVEKEVIEETVAEDQLTDVPSEETVKPIDKTEIENMMKELLEAKLPKQEQTAEIPSEYQQAMELYQYLQNNPDVVNVMRQADPNAQQVASQVAPTPLELELQSLKQKVTEIEEKDANDFYTSQVTQLKEKYSDYDENKVLDFAYDNGLTGENNLENAYFVLKARGELGEVKEEAPKVDENLRKEIEAEVRANIEAEINKNAEITGTTVSSTDATPQVSEVTLTAEETKLAKVFGMTPEEWKKYSV